MAIERIIIKAAQKKAAQKAVQKGAQKVAQKGVRKAAQDAAKNTAKKKVLSEYATKAEKNGYFSRLEKKYANKIYSTVEKYSNPVEYMREKYFDKIQRYADAAGAGDDFTKWRQQFLSYSQRDAIGKELLKDSSRSRSFFAGTQEIWENSNYHNRLDAIKSYYRDNYYSLKEQGVDTELTRVMDNYDVDNLSTLDLIDITEEVSGVSLDEGEEDDEKYKEAKARIMLAMRNGVKLTDSAKGLIGI